VLLESTKKGKMKTLQEIVTLPTEPVKCPFCKKEYHLNKTKQIWFHDNKDCWAYYTVVPNVLEYIACFNSHLYQDLSFLLGWLKSEGYYDFGFYYGEHYISLKNFWFFKINLEENSFKEVWAKTPLEAVTKAILEIGGKT